MGDGVGASMRCLCCARWRRSYCIVFPFLTYLPTPHSSLSPSPSPFTLPPSLDLTIPPLLHPLLTAAPQERLEAFKKEMPEVSRDLDTARRHHEAKNTYG
jgi:hypothetical protein